MAHGHYMACDVYVTKNQVKLFLVDPVSTIEGEIYYSIFCYLLGAENIYYYSPNSNTRLLQIQRSNNACMAIAYKIAIDLGKLNPEYL